MISYILQQQFLSDLLLATSFLNVMIKDKSI